MMFFLSFEISVHILDTQGFLIRMGREIWVSKLRTYKWAVIIIPFKKLGGNAIKARIILQEMYYMY